MRLQRTRSLAVSAVPLLLTIVVPAPFALRVSGSSVWAQNAVVAVSRIGLTPSFILFTVGVVTSVSVGGATAYIASGEIEVPPSALVS